MNKKKNTTLPFLTKVAFASSSFKACGSDVDIKIINKYCEH